MNELFQLLQAVVQPRVVREALIDHVILTRFGRVRDRVRGLGVARHAVECGHRHVDALGAGASQTLDTGSNTVAYDSLITQLIDTCTPVPPSLW